jgi:hypothetical protein
MAGPEQFGPYRLDELIGRGGMGEVYRAFDTTRDRAVAVKRLPRHLADDRGYAGQFRRESRIAARLREPHIIPIHDFGEIDGTLYIDMRLVEGVNLATLLERDGPLPPERAVSIVLQIASALAAAHAEHLVHRDVKPANTLVTAHDFVYLVDFGIARDTTATEFGPAGAVVGSTECMAPEQFTDGSADHRADIYALGGLLYTALTAERPFPVSGPAAQMHAHLHTPPPKPSDQVAELPAALDAVVATAMAKNPDDRFQSAREFADALRAAVAGAQAGAGAPGSPGTLATAAAGSPSNTAPGSPSTAAPGSGRALGLPTSPTPAAIAEWARQVVDQSSWRQVTSQAGWRQVTSQAGWRQMADQAKADLNLDVAEELSRRTVNAVSDLVRSRWASALTTLRNESTGPTATEPPDDDRVVMKTAFGEGEQRTVIEVRVPVAAVAGSELDLERILADAYAAANAQARGDLRGKHVTVDAADPAGGQAQVTVTDDDPPGSAPD